MVDIKKQHGGKRPGSGRPKKYPGGTVSRRIPKWLADILARPGGSDLIKDALQRDGCCIEDEKA